MPNNQVDIYTNKSEMISVSIPEAINYIKAGTHKAYGMKAYEIPPEWLEEAPAENTRAKLQLVEDDEE